MSLMGSPLHTVWVVSVAVRVTGGFTVTVMLVLARQLTSILPTLTVSV